jgi:hypothetical protein
MSDRGRETRKTGEGGEGEVAYIGITLVHSQHSSYTILQSDLYSSLCGELFPRHIVNQTPSAGVLDVILQMSERGHG